MEPSLTFMYRYAALRWRSDYNVTLLTFASAYVTQKQRPNRHKLVFSDISTKGENLIVKVREVDGSIRNPTKRELVRAVQMENPWQGNRAHTYAPNYF